MDENNKDWIREFDRLFKSTGMGADFDAMQRYMEKMMEELMRDGMDRSMSEPYVYGFTLRVGPDGQPHIQKFGNLEIGNDIQDQDHSNDMGNRIPGRREPLTDVIEGEENVHVTIEIPGVEKKDIDLEVREEQLVISVDSESHRYYKEVGLPCTVDMDSAKATYNNGVLDITLDKLGRQTRSTKVMIE